MPKNKKHPDEICSECGSDEFIELDLYFECDNCGHTWNKPTPDDEEDDY